MRAFGFIRSVADPRAWVGMLRLLHYVNYSHVLQRRRLRCGPTVRIAPNVSLTNAERIEIGRRTNIGARCYLWAGDLTGRISIGEDCLFGPEVFVTASNYESDPTLAPSGRPTVESDVRIGARVWLGARVTVLPGVTIGDGAVVGAGSVVSRPLPAGCTAAGSPAVVLS